MKCLFEKKEKNLKKILTNDPISCNITFALRRMTILKRN